MPQRRRPAAPPDLNATLELLAVRIGDRIGESIVRAIGRVAGVEAPRATERKRCAHEGCGRPAAAKGLCKSHYNLMLYHRRRAETPAGARQTRRSTGRRPTRPR